MNLWAIAKDVLLTGLGITVILAQVFSQHPSDVLLVTGLALTVPSVASHSAALLSSRTGGHISPSGAPSLPSSPTRSPEDERP